MAVALSFVDKTSYVAINGSASNLVFDTLPTSGGVVIEVIWEYSSAVPNLGSFSLATDGAPTDATAQISASNGKGVVYLFWASCTDATQALSYTNSGSYVEGLAKAYSITGHNTSTPFSTETTDTASSTLNFTFGTTGNALLAHFFSTAETGLAFSEGTWSYLSDTELGVSYYSANLSSGTKAITITNGVPVDGCMVEIVAAAGGGGGGKPANYYSQL